MHSRLAFFSLERAHHGGLNMNLDKMWVFALMLVHLFIQVISKFRDCSSEIARFVWHRALTRKSIGYTERIDSKFMHKRSAHPSRSAPASPQYRLLMLLR
jgi:hypothetical protein